MAQIVTATAVALDVSEKQLLAHFPEDRQFPWHHRVLMFRIKDSQWVICTPTLSVKIEDISEYMDFHILGWAAPFPAECRPLYAFDTLSPEDFERLRFKARELAEVMGIDLPAAAAGVAGDTRWLLSDPSLPCFGEEVPAATITG